MKEDALPVVRRGIDLWNARDMDGIVLDWAEDIIIKPDPYFPDSGVSVGRDACRRFWETQAETMGMAPIEILEADDLGDRCLVRCRQHVVAPGSGVEGAYDWTFLGTVRDGKIVMYEFFLDRDAGRKAAGLA